MQFNGSVLSLGAKNSVVYDFKRLVDDSTLEKIESVYQEVKHTASSLASAADFGASLAGVNLSLQSTVDTMVETVEQLAIVKDVINMFNPTIPKVRIAEFDKELYNKALSLPEAKSLSFVYGDDTLKLKYGRFVGGNTYKDFNGTLDKTSIQEQLGWITTDSSSSSYCIFNGVNSSFIISLRDFSPEPIVADFWPLYEKLKKSSSETALNDIHDVSSLVVSFKYLFADLILLKKYQAWLLLINANMSADRFKSLIGDYKAKNISTKSPATYGQIEHNKTMYEEVCALSYKVSTAQNQNEVSASKFFSNVKCGDFKEVQAIITEVFEDNKEVKDIEIYKGRMGKSMLKCFQTPESISYGVSASYDTPSPRGSQVPFSFYQGANAISVSFTLKFEINEVKTKECINDEINKNASLSDVADCATDFTRPWEITGASGVNTISPKLVQVILPSIEGVGYITNVSITYSGSMTGNATIIDENKEDSFSIVDYGYTELEASFEMMLLKSVKLKEKVQDQPQDGFDFSNDEEELVEKPEVDLEEDITTKSKEEVVTSYDKIFSDDFDFTGEVDNSESEADKITGIKVDLSYANQHDTGQHGTQDNNLNGN